MRKRELNIIGYRRVWYIVSGTLLIISIGAFALWGLKLGIDFTGGSLVQISFQGARPSLDKITSTISSDFGKADVSPVGDNAAAVRLKSLSEEDHQKLLTEFKAAFPPQNGQDTVHEDQFTSIGPTIGAELGSKSLWAIGTVLLAIVCYIAWAFRKVSRPVPSWQYGLAAIIALFHDVFLPTGVFVFLGKFAGIEVDTLFITAILTVLGFSVHDTIVVFDRIRENLLHSSDPFPVIVNRSVNETMARSINTSLTTLLVLLMTFFFGGASVHYFVLTLILGIIFGTYSSIFIASPLLVSWYTFAQKRRARKG